MRHNFHQVRDIHPLPLEPVFETEMSGTNMVEDLVSPTFHPTHQTSLERIHSVSSLFDSFRGCKSEVTIHSDPVRHIFFRWSKVEVEGIHTRWFRTQVTNMSVSNFVQNVVFQCQEVQKVSPRTPARRVGTVVTKTVRGGIDVTLSFQKRLGQKSSEFHVSIMPNKVESKK